MVYSATQTPEQVQAALEGRGYTDFTAEHITTAPPPEAKPDPSAPAAEPAADPNADAAAAPRRNKPGRTERLLSRTQKQLEELLNRDRQRDIELAELRGRLSAPTQTTASAADPGPTQQAPSPVPVPEPEVKANEYSAPKPRRDEFLDSDDPDEAYMDAMIEWRSGKSAFDGTEKARIEAAQAEQRARTQEADDRGRKWIEQLSAARQEYADLDAVLSKQHFDETGKPLPVASAPMREYVAAHPIGAKILYWLGTHPKEANRLALQTNADPRDIAKYARAIADVVTEFDRIQGEIEKNPPKKPVAEVPAAPRSEDAYDEDEDVDEGDVDPNLSKQGDVETGRNVPQAPSPGAVESQRPPQGVHGVVGKPDPVSRVAGRTSMSGNRPIAELPAEVIRNFSVDEYRQRRMREGSRAARGS